MSISTHTPLNHCLGCGHKLSAASGVTHDAVPTVDDVTICHYCGHLMGFNPDLTVKELTPQQMFEVAGNPDVLRLLEMRKLAMDKERAFAEKVQFNSNPDFIKDLRNYAQERITKLMSDIADRASDLLGRGDQFRAGLFFSYASMIEMGYYGMVMTGGNPDEMSQQKKDDTTLFAALYAYGLYLCVEESKRTSKPPVLTPEVHASEMFEKITGRPWELDKRPQE
jgi:hypothetical protein